jgi:glycerate dehydrogenase
MSYPRIVIAESFPASIGDIDWAPITDIASTTIFEKSSAAQLIQRAKAAEIIVINKIVITPDLLDQLPYLKCICLLATGYNNVDVAACHQRNIIVCNAKDYSSNSVAQHVFAMLLHILNNVADHDKSIRDGGWTASWSYYRQTIDELSGKTMGLFGYGNIARKVAKIAQAFGMKVIVYKRHPIDEPGIEMVDIDHLFSRADIISLHAPLTPETTSIVNKTLLQRMKKTAILINTARGGLINEMDLKEHLVSREIRAAALDVLTEEPPSEGHPLLGMDNCIITPHQAWTSIDARRKLVDIVAQNIKGYLNGELVNVVG